MNNAMHKNDSIINSFKNAFHGLFLLLKLEKNAKYHLTATVAVILVASLLQLSMIE